MHTSAYCPTKHMHCTLSLSMSNSVLTWARSHNSFMKGNSNHIFSGIKSKILLLNIEVDWILLREDHHNHCRSAPSEQTDWRLRALKSHLVYKSTWQNHITHLNSLWGEDTWSGLNLKMILGAQVFIGLIWLWWKTSRLSIMLIFRYKWGLHVERVFGQHSENKITRIGWLYCPTKSYSIVL